MSAREPWWRRLPGRVEAEREHMASAHPEMVFDTSLPHGGWRGRVAGVEELLLLEYSRHHPRVPPRIREVGSRGIEPRWIPTLHRYADGGLCLFTHDEGAEAWHRSYTAADALSRLVDLARGARAGAEPPIFTSVPDPIPGLAVHGQGLIPRSLARHLRLRASTRATWGRFEGWVAVRDGNPAWIRLGIGQLALPGASYTVSVTDVERLLLPRDRPIKGIFVHLPSLPAALYGPLALSWDLEAFIAGRLGPDSGVPLDAGGPILLSWREVREEPASHRMAVFVTRRLMPLLGISMPTVALLHLPMHVLDAEQLDARSRPILGRCDAAWQRIHVIVVGLGALGSAIALELARAGVRHFTLFDPDRLTPANLGRHLGEVDELMRDKVAIVRDRIMGQNPRANVQAHAMSAPDGQYDEQSRVFCDAMERPDTLLIVATAEHHTEDVLNAEAIERAVPAIFASVLGPAAYGRVYRVIPGRTPCHACVVESGRRRLPGMPRYEEASPPAGLPADRYGAPSMPGVSLDIAPIGLAAARMALRTLAERYPEICYPGPARDHIILNNHGGWVFGPDETQRVVELRPLEDCPVCAGATPAPS